ncbi:MAG: hypothetical protein JWP89_2800 [Schlesneria sp.]|nr:hypothetical protein [Schlesneria sp.]
MTPTDDDYIKELIRRALAPVLNRLAELERQVNPGKAAVKPKQQEPLLPKKKKKLPGAVINGREAAKRRAEEEQARGKRS